MRWRRECQSIPIERSSIFAPLRSKPTVSATAGKWDFAFDKRPSRPMDRHRPQCHQATSERQIAVAPLAAPSSAALLSLVIIAREQVQIAGSQRPILAFDCAVARASLLNLAFASPSGGTFAEGLPEKPAKMRLIRKSDAQRDFAQQR